MGKTFTDVNGTSVEFEKNNTDLDQNTDIVTGKISTYLVDVDGRRYEVNKENYEAIESYLEWKFWGTS